MTMMTLLLLIGGESIIVAVAHVLWRFQSADTLLHWETGSDTDSETDDSDGEEEGGTFESPLKIEDTISRQFHFLRKVPSQSRTIVCI